MTMQIRIIKPGLLSTVQDLGRHLYRSQAVPVSGAMDTLSARIANKAVGNPDDAAVIEFTYGGAEFKTETAILIAYAGDGAVLKSGTQVLPAERPIFIPSDTKLHLENNPAGSRTYLSVSGGWDVPEVLGSRSTFITANLGGFQGRSLKSMDVLSSSASRTSIAEEAIKSLKSNSINYPLWSLGKQSLLPLNRKTIHIMPAREFNWFNGRSIVDFLSAPYTLSPQSNRMGFRLEGAPITPLVKRELLSTAVTPGTIQVTGNGSLILLMADCQTTGGYPRIAQVAAVDLPLCGQLKPGDVIYFKEMSYDEAEMQYLEREQQLQKLTVAVRCKFL